MNRVAITDIGIASCLGCDLTTVSATLREGCSGIVVDEKRVVLGFHSPLTGMVVGFDPLRRLSRKQRKFLPNIAVQAHAAAMDASAMAGLSPEDVQNDETDLTGGADSSCLTIIESINTLRRESVGFRSSNACWILRYSQ